MAMIKNSITAVLLLVVACVFGQDQEAVEKKKRLALEVSQNLTWEGNQKLSENQFASAEANYRKAISKSNANAAAPYNLGNAQYNNGSFNEAFGHYKKAGETAASKGEKHNAYHNMGNVFMQNKQYEKAVEAYKESLRKDPTDEETRYNLALAQEMLKKEQEENQNNQDQNDENKDQDQNKEDENKDQNKDQDKGDNDKDDQGDQEDENKEGDKEKEDSKEGDGDEKSKEEKQGDKSQDQQQQEQQQQPRPNQLSPQQVKNLMDAIQNEEKKVKDKMDAKKVKGAKVKNEKDW
ncbi:tetratricopeptide repeat protein [Sediminicola luteus]|uniref:Uncharacterized protein n=1 Tax=Sediminicola luteus TaxID=319238 RepID=A0A2A4G5X8_9FLAO|nr:tetratricopeptide repeat protein [Sediminicola luteus]PCE63142.1 hypothetical protein B7P33_16675 [Sediminicola luteus]